MAVIPWSWSSLEAYETCPKKFYEEKIAKTVPPDTDSEYLVWGNEVHAALDKGVSEGIPLPGRTAIYQKYADRFRAAPGVKYTEQKLAVTIDGKPCGFWDAKAWNRGIDDIVIINGSKAFSGDYKTGKEKKHSGQLELSAVRVFAHNPKVEQTSTAFIWLQTGNITKATFVREQVPTILDSYKGRVAKIEWSAEHNIWPAKPSGLCKRSKKPGSTYMGCQVANCPHSEIYKRPA